LDKIEVPENADPHHTRYDVQPAEDKRPPARIHCETRVVPAHQDQRHDNNQNETGRDRSA
jgi:hypothetical protein